MASRDATTRWTGDLTEGSGVVSFDSSNIGEHPVSFPARVGNPDGQTSPEELLAAAHSSCLAMNLSGVLAKEGLTATSIDVSAEVTVAKEGGGLTIKTSAITLRAAVPGVDAEKFAELAADAERTCPVSRALTGLEITMDAQLAG